MEKAYNIKQSAELLGIKPRTVRQWIYDGKISAIKINGTRYWLIFESQIKKLRGDDDEIRCGNNKNF